MNSHDLVERQKKGVSSFALHDPKMIFREFKLKEGDLFLDLGCGAGDYAFYASRIVGVSGIVYALDKWPEVISVVTSKATSKGINNIKAMSCDITTSLPLKDNSIDVCLLATVLHIPDVTKNIKNLLKEIRRILKPEGRILVIEIKKEDMSFGPPMHMRLSPDDTESILSLNGFMKTGLTDLGYSYMIQFKVK